MIHWDHETFGVRRAFQHYIIHISRALDQRLKLQFAVNLPKRQPAPVIKTKLSESLAHVQPNRFSWHPLIELKTSLSSHHHWSAGSAARPSRNA
jgi:hypothetical protein